MWDVSTLSSPQASASYQSRGHGVSGISNVLLTLHPPPPGIKTQVEDGREASMYAYGPSLSADGTPHAVYEIGIESCRQAYALREHGLFERTNAMQTLSSLHQGDIYT